MRIDNRLNEMTYVIDLCKAISYSHPHTAGTTLGTFIAVLFSDRMVEHKVAFACISLLENSTGIRFVTGSANNSVIRSMIASCTH